MTAAVRTAAVLEGGRVPVPGVKNVIAVGAGKGGVGKTTVAVNVAVALAQLGSRVGIIDGDIYGPNVPIMLGLHTELVADDQGRIIPAERYGVQVVSMGFLTHDDSPVNLAAGPMLHGAVQQFFRQVAWDDLDYLVIDLPAWDWRRRAQPQPVGARLGRDCRNDTSAGVPGRHAARDPDVPEIEHPYARLDREYESLRLSLGCGHESDISSDMAPAKSWRRRWKT